MNPLNQKALAFAVKAHEGQFRKDGKTPYIVHPIGVAERLMRWGIDDSNPIIAAAYLHDTLEDTDTQLWQLAAELGDEIACLVVDVTFYGDSKSDKQAWLDGIATSRGHAKLLKAADCLCNVEDFIRDGKYAYAIEYLDRYDKIFEAIIKYPFSDTVYREIKELEKKVREAMS